MKSIAELQKEEEKLKEKLKAKRAAIAKQRTAAKKEKANRLWKLMSPYISETQMIECSDEDVVAIIKAHLNGQKHPLDEKVVSTKETAREEKTQDNEEDE